MFILQLGLTVMPMLARRLAHHKAHGLLHQLLIIVVTCNSAASSLIKDGIWILFIIVRLHLVIVILRRVIYVNAEFAVDGAALIGGRDLKLILNVVVLLLLLRCLIKFVQSPCNLSQLTSVCLEYAASRPMPVRHLIL